MTTWGAYHLFVIGLRMPDRVQLQAMTMLRAVCQAIPEECEKWGKNRHTTTWPEAQLG